MASFGTLRNSTFDTIHASQHRKASLLGLSAYERHKLFVRDYVEFYGRGTRSEAQDDGAVAAAVTERDVLIKEHRFIRGEDDDRPDTWEVRLAKRYYDRLFKEYCIVDLSRYRESKVGMRWRTEKEVVAGKGQFECGEVRCRVTEGLCSYEVNFAYREAGKGKQALVKVRLCRDCAYKLNYRKEKAYKKVTKKLRKFVDRQQAGEKTVDAPAAAGIDPETEAADPCQAGGRQRRREGPGSPLEDAEQPASKRAKRWDSKPSGAGRDDAAEGAGERAGNAGAAAQASGVEAGAGDEGDFWRQKSSSTKQEVELEEDFDKYMEDMFL